MTHLADTAEYRPHLGIGYINRPQRADALASDIATLRTLHRLQCAWTGLTLSSSGATVAHTGGPVEP